MRRMEKKQDQVRIDGLFSRSWNQIGGSGSTSFHAMHSMANSYFTLKQDYFTGPWPWNRRKS